MRRIALLLLAAGSVLAQTFVVRLTPVPIDAAMRATVTGMGTASATLNDRTLTVNGSFEGLRSPATIAQIHQGPAMGVRGPVLFDLTVSKATEGSISGTFKLTPGQVENLLKGKLYIQIHSEKAPDGNLWGWLLLEEKR
ncbi:MAG TPA: CHRD domain-containing protein [Bryobacteraceae bacterium]|nr:CHRD domain-containing protein [Bryobacteraceae bacterium]